MKVNPDVIIKRFEYLNKVLEELERIKKISKNEFLNDFSTILGAERALVLSTNICIDIGAHVLSINKISTPETYGEIFEDLMKLNIINEEIKENLIKFVGLRNLLGHLYTKVNNERIYHIIQEDLTVFYSFKNQIITKFKDQLKKNNK